MHLAVLRNLYVAMVELFKFKGNKFTKVESYLINLNKGIPWRARYHYTYLITVALFLLIN